MAILKFEKKEQKYTKYGFRTIFGVTEESVWKTDPPSSQKIVLFSNLYDLRP